MNELLKAALEYRAKGLSVFPVRPRGKTPLVPWKDFQSRIATEEEIIAWWTKHPTANIGIATGKVSDAFVVDLDKYDPEYSEETSLLYFSDSQTVPTVLTPRLGIHLYFSDPDNPDITIGTRNIPGIDFRGTGGFVVVPPSIGENGKPYKWLNGLTFDRSMLVPPPEEYIKKISSGNGNALHASAFKGASIINNNKVHYKGGVVGGDFSESREPCRQHVDNGQVTVYKCLQEGTRNADIFTIANALAKGGLPIEFAQEVIKIIAKNTKPPYPENEAFKSLQSAYSRKESRDRNVHEEVREYILTQKSLQEVYILLTECLQCLQLSTRQEKKAAYIAFHRLCNEEKLIEKQTDRRGIYRIIDNEKDKNKMDLSSEPEVHEFPVRLPLDLNNMCVISPGNIIVVSGSKSSGKTALMMNVAWMNQKDFEVVYLNSEMHETEFKKRMQKFAPLSHWKITGYKCHNNFEDYIESNPKRIYIVDYLEVHDNFYEIAKPIRKIHEKLGDAICFIGIQMKSGATLGRGGDFSAEKARLYLTMDYNSEEKRTKVTIYDAKEPRAPFDNVRGKWRNVKIIEGNRLSPFVDWRW